LIDHHADFGRNLEEENQSPIRWQSGDGRGVIRELGAVARAVLAASVQLNRYASGTGTWEEIMELGNFSVSLAVKDIQA